MASAQADIQPSIPTNVRQAQPRDLDAVFEIMCLAHEDNGFLTMDPAKVRRVIWALTAHPIDPETGRPIPPLGMIGVIDGETEIAGVCLLFIGEFWYSNDLYIDEALVFVHPDYRASTYAADLIRWAKGVSDTLKLPLHMGVLSTKRTEAKERLYRRYMEPVGAFYAYNRQFAHGPAAQTTPAAEEPT